MRLALPASLRVAFVALAGGLFLSACGINDVPRLEEQARLAWSELQNQYRRRADLVPNLLEAVRKVAPQEAEVLNQASEAKARAAEAPADAATITDPQGFAAYKDAQNRLSAALGRLLAAVERYPELKADAGFSALRAQLEGVEDRIALARKDYREAASAYNASLSAMPGRWVAALLYPEAKPMELFMPRTGA